MKLNPRFILREVAGETILVSLNDIASPKCLLCLNGTGKQIYLMLQDGRTQEEIVAEIAQYYQLEEAIAYTDVEEFLSMLRERNILLDQ